MTLLNETEAEMRLRDLLEQRARLDASIRDLTLYLELGRRLREKGEPSHSQPVNVSEEKEGIQNIPRRNGLGIGPNVGNSKVGSADAAERAVFVARTGTVRPQEPTTDSDLFDGSSASSRSEARRLGKRVLEATRTILAEAGRPMHVSEIHDALTARGLTLAGRDPVAALNTRLWKRATSDGAFMRLGDAVYGLP